MSFRISVLLTVVGCSAVSALAVLGYRRFMGWRRKDPNELERLRRLDVNRRGRITSAEIVDFLEPEPGAGGEGYHSHLIVYKYEVAGVIYEVPQDVSALSGILPTQTLADSRASIKYDPRTPTNSLLPAKNGAGLEADWP